MDRFLNALSFSDTSTDTDSSNSVSVEERFTEVEEKEALVLYELSDIRCEMRRMCAELKNLKEENTRLRNLFIRSGIPFSFTPTRISRKN